MVTAADLRFDAEAHRSWLPDGTEVPHVTSVLAAVGVCTDFDIVVANGGARGRAVETARLRGTAVHMDCHAFDDDDLDWASMDDRILPYVEAWAQFRETFHVAPLTRERRVYHQILNYTGIFDGVFHAGVTHRKCVLIDIKTGDPEDAAAHIQTAAYEQAWISEDLSRAHAIDERWAVWLRPDRVVPYSVINYSGRPDAASDFAKFIACLTVYHEQAGRRRRIT